MSARYKYGYCWEGYERSWGSRRRGCQAASRSGGSPPHNPMHLAGSLAVLLSLGQGSSSTRANPSQSCLHWLVGGFRAKHSSYSCACMLTAADLREIFSLGEF
jgi:hypothetical protein